MAKILIVDDDVRLSETLEGWLSDGSQVVDAAYDGFEAAEYLKTGCYDLIILDVSMPGKSGLEVLREYRSGGGNTPVLMLTGHDSVEDVERGFNAGADDYLRKPFHGKEFIARAKALLRRQGALVTNVLRFGDLTLDRSTLRVTKGETVVSLLPKEFALLEFFMRNPKQVYSAESLLLHVWSTDSEATTQAVISCLKRLRLKIDAPDGASYIHNIRGAGYMLDDLSP
jgi:DNA-binding response OmpR family regulator